MLQLQVLRQNKDEVVKALKKRNFDAESLLTTVLDLDEKRRAIQAKLDNALAESNKLSKEIGMLYKSGKADEANAIKAQTAELKESSKLLGEELNQTAEALQQNLYLIPNVPHVSVPAGNSDEDNEEIFREGEVPTLKEGALPHWELAKKYNLIDFELGAKITGAGFPIYKGKGAQNTT